MANLANTPDCVNYMLKQAAEKDQGQGSFFESNALLYLNIAHREIVSGSMKLVPEVVATFPWAKADQEKVIVTEYPLSSSTVSITNNSPTISFFLAPGYSLTNYFIRFGATDNTTYRIISHTAGNNVATLDSVVVASTNATSSYVAFKADYTVGSADVLRLVAPLNGYKTNGSGDTTQVDGITEFDFRRNFPVISQGEPTHFALIRDNYGTLTLRFSHYTASRSRFDVPYIPIPAELTISDLSIPLVPLQHRQTLCEYALHYLYMDKGDDRSTGAYQRAQIGYSVMLREIGMSDVTFEPFKPNVEVKGA